MNEKFESQTGGPDPVKKPEVPDTPHPTSPQPSPDPPQPYPVTDPIPGSAPDTEPVPVRDPVPPFPEPIPGAPPDVVFEDGTK